MTHSLPALSYISSLHPFTDSLAQGLINLYGPDELKSCDRSTPQNTHKNQSFSLHDVLILMPNQRACGQLIHSFSQISKQTPLLLPTIRPIGTIEQDSLFFHLTHLNDDRILEEFLTFPKPMSPLKRLALLTQMILVKEEHHIPLARAVHLAQKLIELLDRLIIEEKSLDTIQEHELQLHTSLYHQDIMKFLTILHKNWPLILKEEQESDAESYKIFCQNLQIRLWRENPPQTPIIIAGSTGSIPSTRKLIQCVSQLPYGHVILPGFIQPENHDDKKIILKTPTHPQYHLYHLLNSLNAFDKDIPAWGDLTQTSFPQHAPSERLKTVITALKPSEQTDTWRFIDFDLARGIHHISCINAPSITAEARAIALTMREAVEYNKSVLLVSPNNQLSISVQAALSTWHIIPDSSLGYHILDTEAGQFIRYVGDACHHRLAPIPLLTLFKHPLLKTHHKNLYIFEKHILRGYLLNPCVETYHKKFEEIRPSLSPYDVECIQSFLKVLSKLDDKIKEISPQASFSQYLQIHLEICSHLVPPSFLWKGKEGSALSDFIETLQTASFYSDMTFSDYVMILILIAKKNFYYDPNPTHPNIKIRPPIEARLHQADLVIIGSLNQQDWEHGNDLDPWLSPAMRAMIGLSDSEEKRALAAHDFVQFFCQPEVILSRATTVDQAPVIPSMWLTRLQAVLHSHNLSLPQALCQYYAEREQEQPLQPITPPMPSPPLDKRPKRLSATAIQTWELDPYSIYAKHILKLPVLDMIEQEMPRNFYGQLVHSLFEELWKKYPTIPQEKRYPTFLQAIEETLLPYYSSSYLSPFKKENIKNIAEWFYNWARQDYEDLIQSFVEEKGTLTIPYSLQDKRYLSTADTLSSLNHHTETDSPSTGVFTLSARADRIDVLPHHIRIIDYKTGTIPTVKDIKDASEPQMGLEFLILVKGGFKNIPYNRQDLSARFMRPREKKNDKNNERSLFDNDCQQMIFYAEQKLLKLIKDFYIEQKPYVAIPNPNQIPRRYKYSHLSRYYEWSLHKK